MPSQPLWTGEGHIGLVATPLEDAMFTISKDLAAIGLFSAVVSLGAAGCATSSGGPARGPLGVTMAQGRGGAVRAGAARVISSHVNPLAPIHATSDGRSIAVRFAHPRAAGALVSLDSESLLAVSPEQRAPPAAATAQNSQAVRIALHGGGFIACWKRGSAEWGYRLMSQSWTAEGSPLGDPVVVSPDAEVIGTPQLVSVDGERVVAIFAVSSEGGFELLAVSLEAPAR
jgi:hypothetical protein